MSQPTPSRRSARGRVPNKKYSVDAFAELDILDFEDEREEQKRQAVRTGSDDDVRSDEDFDASKASSDDLADEAGEDDPNHDEDEDEGEDTLGAGDVAESDHERAPDTTEGGENGVSSSSQNLRVSPPKNAEPGARRPTLTDPSRWRFRKAPIVTNRPRGLVSRTGNSTRQKISLDFYGGQLAKVVSMSMTRFISTVAFPSKSPAYAPAYPPGFHNGIDYDESGPLRDYFPAYKPVSSSRQVTEPVMDRDHVRYFPQASSSLLLFVGPYHSQSRFELKFAQALGLEDAFSSAAQDRSASNSAAPGEPSRRKGWMLNVGSRILSMAWSPARPGSAQYLAVAVDQSSSSNQQDRTPFTPNSYCSSVQIWRVQHSAPDGGPQTSSAWTDPPKLVHVICTKWGGCRRLRWCPTIPSTAAQSGCPDALHRIGSLAAVWTDGCVRVLEVSLPSNHSQIFWHYQTPSFVGRPPNSMCSCVEWLSETSLAAGCANGFVAIWDLSSIGHQRAGLTPSQNRPSFYQEYSDSYILELASGAPTMPHLLGLISTSGHAKLIDLRHPGSENVLFLRSRLYSTVIRFSPHNQCFYTSDDHGDVVLLLIKRFYSGRRVIATGANSAGGAVIACSPLHTSILVGTPSGIVACTNPIRRQFDNRVLMSWSQKWFVHEWRRLDIGSTRLPDGEAGMSLDPTSARERRQRGYEDQDTLKHDGATDQEAGKVRLTEGYKVEKQTIGIQGNGKLVLPTVMYDEKQAITALEWNPNLDCAGWAAAGMGSGLLRIEDVLV